MTRWYVKVGDAEFGPYGAHQVKLYAQEGRIVSNTEVRREQDRSWIAAEKVSGLLEQIQSPEPISQSQSSRTSNEGHNATPKTLWIIVSIATLVVAGLALLLWVGITASDRAVVEAIGAAEQWLE